MNKQHLSNFEKRKIFLNEYYFGVGTFITILRIIGGPLILVLGLSFNFSGNSRLELGYGGFMIIYGIYYTLKPLIMILTHKGWFRNFDLDYLVEPEKIIIQSGKSKSQLDFSELKTVLKRKTYFALKTKSRQGIYLPFKFLQPTEINILNNLEKDLSNKNGLKMKEI